MKNYLLPAIVMIAGPVLFGCSGRPEQSADAVLSANTEIGLESATAKKDSGCGSSSKIGACDLSRTCKETITVKYVSIESKDLASYEKRGDGVCASGSTNCCIVPPTADAGDHDKDLDDYSSICTNFQTDSKNCGSCGTVCPPAQSCVSGSCVCPAGQSLCGSACTSESSDNSNCGACGVACAPGATCTAGVCVVPCAAGQTLCGGVCANTQSDPNNCGACGTVCPSGDSCEAGTCISPTQANSCLPTSSLSVLMTGGNVNAYVPNGSWSESGTGVQVVPLEGDGSRATIATPSPVNSCSCNSVTGQTVCTANTTDVYLITGSTLTATLSSGATGSERFSGGSCENCGVTIDAVANKAVISVGLSTGGPGGFQFLDLASSTFSPPIPGGASTSEDILIDPARHLLLSPNEGNDYQLLNTSTSVVSNFSPAGIAGEFDSAAEDCTTGIGLASVEFTGQVFLVDLTQASVAGSTWSAPSSAQSLPEFASFSAGTCGIAVAPGSHLGVVAGEFGGAGFGAIQLPATSGTGTPALVDYVAATLPNDPGGAAWQMGLDPHTVTAYKSPNTGAALAVMSNDARTYLAVVDLQKLLSAARVTGSHSVAATVDLVASGIVSFVSVH